MSSKGPKSAAPKSKIVPKAKTVPSKAPAPKAKTVPKAKTAAPKAKTAPKASAPKVAAKSKAAKPKVVDDDKPPKRPPTAYFLWANDNRETLKKKHPNLKQTEIAKIAGQQWGKMTDAAKKKWVDLGEKAKAKYAKDKAAWEADHPDYVKPKSSKAKGNAHVLSYVVTGESKTLIGSFSSLAKAKAYVKEKWEEYSDTDVVKVKADDKLAYYFLVESIPHNPESAKEEGETEDAGEEVEEGEGEGEEEAGEEGEEEGEEEEAGEEDE